MLLNVFTKKIKVCWKDNIFLMGLVTVFYFFFYKTMYNNRRKRIYCMFGKKNQQWFLVTQKKEQETISWNVKRKNVFISVKTLVLVIK